MYEFTLQKSLYFELDPMNMKEVKEREEGKQTFRTIEVSYDSVPEITSITSEERKLPYLVRYYLYVNDEKLPADIHRPEVAQVIYEFYKDHFPGYLKEGLPDDIRGTSILDCFEVFQMPSYRPKYAWPGIVNLEDLRAGLVPDKRPKHSFPGLELLINRSDRDPDKPAISEYDGYEELDGDLGKTRNKIDNMKAQLASEMKAMNIDELLKDIPEAQVDNTKDVLDDWKKGEGRKAAGQTEVSQADTEEQGE